MRRQAGAAGMRGVPGGLHDRLLLREIVAGLMDEPHLDVVGLALQLARDERARLVRGADLDDRRIAEVELRAVDHRDQRAGHRDARRGRALQDRKSTRLNSSHMSISYAVFCLKKKTKDMNTVSVANKIPTQKHNK